MNSNNADTPDSPTNSITGTSDIDVRVKLNMANWEPGTAKGLVSKDRASDGNRSWFFRVTGAGALMFAHYPNGNSASIIQPASSDIVPFAPGDRLGAGNTGRQ